MIDFDTAAPASRLHDLGYAAWLWLDLGSPAITASDQQRRLAVFVEAYGMHNAAVVLSAVLKRQAILAASADHCSAYENGRVLDLVGKK
jgi:hypothetical protein